MEQKEQKIIKMIEHNYKIEKLSDIKYCVAYTNDLASAIQIATLLSDGGLAIITNTKNGKKLHFVGGEQL